MAAERAADAEDLMKKLLMQAAVKAIARGGFEIIQRPPSQHDHYYVTPPRPDVAPVGKLSEFWIVPPHTGLTRNMLPEGPKL